MADTTEIMNALKWWNAERFKTLQRKLTTAKNTIQNEALSPNLRPFFSNDEIDTLKEASRILGTVKTKIEHTKEIKAREEKARDIHLEKCKRQRLALLEKVFPMPKTDDDTRQILLWALALSLHHRSIDPHGYYYERKYISSDMERAFDPKNQTTVVGAGVGWKREVKNFLEEHLWFYDESPDPDKLDAIQRLFTGKWNKEVATNLGTRAI